jgi:hypothetical protein
MRSEGDACDYEPVGAESKVPPSAIIRQHDVRRYLHPQFRPSGPAAQSSAGSQADKSTVGIAATTHNNPLRTPAEEQVWRDPRLCRPDQHAADQPQDAQAPGCSGEIGRGIRASHPRALQFEADAHYATWTARERRSEKRPSTTVRAEGAGGNSDTGRDRRVR